MTEKKNKLGKLISWFIAIPMDILQSILVFPQSFNFAEKISFLFFHMAILWSTLNLESTKVTHTAQEVVNVFVRSHILESLDTERNSWVSKVIIQEKISRLFTKNAAISDQLLFRKIFYMQSDFWALTFLSACEKCRIFLLLSLYARRSEYKCMFTSENSFTQGTGEQKN